jgi:hypothetical protein
MRRLALPPQVGWPGVTAALALALAWPLASVLAPRWQEQAKALQATRLSTPPPAPVAAETQLPAVTDVNARVADLLDLASRNHVQVEHSQQRQDDSGPVQRLLLTMSARGGYAELREFLADALQADPGLALLRLRWRRPDVQTGSLEAELQWSLLMPAASPMPSLARDAGVGAPARPRPLLP